MPTRQRQKGFTKVEELRAWQRIFRDFLIVIVGAFMLVHETIWSSDPNIYIIGAGLTALGIPPALRLDERLRDRDERQVDYDGKSK